MVARFKAIKMNLDTLIAFFLLGFEPFFLFYQPEPGGH
jgi:hypothetical protein